MDRCRTCRSSARHGAARKAMRWCVRKRFAHASGRDRIMTLDGHVFTGVFGVRGFDANVRVTPQIAAAFSEHGYRFCVRYVPREAYHDEDLTAAEARVILDAGLAFMAVQHEKSVRAWTPKI